MTAKKGSKKPVYKLVVNRCFENVDKDEFHEFKSLKAMREFIDIDDCFPMEVTIYKDGVQQITMPHSVYWRLDRHPKMKEMLGDMTAM